MRPEVSTRAIVLSERDNVATVLDALESGGALDCGGLRVVATQNIPAGHKVALASIERGEAVIKYGEPIGRATRAIVPGDHVHVHNVQSERGRGDRAS